MKGLLPLIKPNMLTIGVDASALLPLPSDPNAPDFHGFEVDLTRAIAARLGLSVRYKGALWSDIIGDLQAGKIDIICTAATITEGRKMIVDFSQPYLDTQLAIVVKDGSEIKELKDLEGAGVGVRIATSAEEFLRSQANAGLIRAFHMNRGLRSARSGRSRCGN